MFLYNNVTITFQIPSSQSDRVLCNFLASFAAPAIIHRRSNKIQPDGEEKRSQKGFSSKKPISSLQDPISEPAAGSENTNIVAASPMSTESSSDSQTPKEDAPPLITASASKLQDPPSEPTTESGKNNTVDAVNSEKVILMTNPEEFQTCDGKKEGDVVPQPANNTNNQTSGKQDQWTGLFKGTTKKLQKRGESFMLPSGEYCVTIPNSVIEKNRKSWDSFIIGQFYSDPPSQGTIQKIVNGIWSKQFMDITVSKMEGFTFVLRIPNASTRANVLKKCLWQIEGQTMFVAKWKPGVVPTKPELTSAPIWLELRDVPLQFFNEEALEHIASQVGDPKFLHPQTANKSNLEVAKVFTIIDPRVPLPEAVNARFESGEIRRIRVSSPWMPPVCSFCKEVGHPQKRCKKAPITCKICKSTGHLQADCTRAKGKTEAKHTDDNAPPKSPIHARKPPYAATQRNPPHLSLKKSKTTFSKMELGGTSLPAGIRASASKGAHPPDLGSPDTSPAESDSSDIDSPQSPLSADSGFQEFISRRQKKKDRGRGPKNK
ncbi:unnamed protein product [Brassica oleracea var. botrytis]